MEKATLIEIQKKLQEAFCSPNQQAVDWVGVRKFVSDLPPVAIETRVDIYRSGYFIRLNEALKDDFPRLYLALGEENFRVLLREYVAAFPSRHQSLGELGRHLAEFIARTSNGERYPLLVDLARVEWLALESFWAHEAAPSLPMEVDSFSLRLNPSVRVLESEFPLLKIWNGTLELSPEVVVRSQKWKRRRRDFFLIRESGTVYLKEIEAFEAAFLKGIEQGLGMEEAGEKSFALWTGAEDGFAAKVQASLSRWVSERVLLVH